MKKCLLFSVLMAFFAISAMASSQDNSSHLFSRWYGLSVAELTQEAQRLDAERKMDSLQIIYRYIVFRLDNGQISDKDRPASIKAMIRLGYLYANYYSNYPIAHSYLLHSLQLARKYNDMENMSYAYLALAILYHSEDITQRSQENLKLTMDYLSRSLHYAIKTGNWRRVCYVMENMTTFSYGAKKIKAVEPLLKKFYQTPIPPNTPHYKYTLLLCKGIEAMANGRYNQATKRFDEMRHNISDNDITCLQTYYANMSEIYFLKQDYPSAIAMMNKIKDLAVQQHDRYSQAQAWDMLTKYYALTGNEEMRKTCRLNYLELQSQLLNEMGLRRIAEMRLQMHLDSAIYQLKEEQQKAQQQRTTAITSFIIALLLSALLVVMLVAYRRLRSHHRDLYMHSLELLRTEDNERKELMKLKEMLEASECHTSTDKEEGVSSKIKYQSNQLDEEEKNTIYFKVRQAMLDTELICQEGFSLKQLSEVVGERQRNISQVINEKTGGNFRTFLNGYRIREACRRINDTEHYGNLSIMGIAESVGIKSRSQFTTSFRRIVGLTPTEYARQRNERID